MKRNYGLVLLGAAFAMGIVVSGSPAALAQARGGAAATQARGGAAATQARGGGGRGGFTEQGGEAIYKNVCQACHMPDAKGAVGAGMYPALAKNPKLAVAGYPISVVINGQKAMPAFGGLFSDEQIADVLNYVRTNFGNNYKDKITPAQVKAARP